MYNTNSSPTLTNVTFSGNLVTTASGGGMYNKFGSHPMLVNVAFSGNTSGNGGGMYNEGSNPSLTDVSFSANVSTGDGGGLSNFANSSPALTNVIFSGNAAAKVGGGMRNKFGSHPVLINAVFSGNAAGTNGGGMWNGRTANPSLTNVTFSGNLAAGSGGGMYSEDDSHPTASNSIFWNNRDSSGTGTITATIFNSSSTITLTHSLVQGTGGSANWTTNPSFMNGGNNLDSDPLFAATTSPITVTTSGDARLLPGSPAIDSGLNSAIAITTDVAGKARKVNGIVDMGAYESQGFTLTISGGNKQSAMTNIANPLQVTVSSSAGEPVGPGGVISYTVSAVGASFTQTVYTASTNVDGVARLMATANTIIGTTYYVTVTARGASNMVVFSLTNGGNIYLPIVVNNN